MRCVVAATILLGSACLIGCSFKEQDPKYKEIMALPDGIEIAHSPNPVHAHERGRSGRNYTWQFATTVRTSRPRLRIVEFGVFHWAEDRWNFDNYTDSPFTNEDFAEWYSCPDGIIYSGKEYRDSANWVSNPELIERRHLWYYVGMDDEGKKCKGVAAIREVAELEPQQ